jgi:hypothetical protein
MNSLDDYLNVLRVCRATLAQAGADAPPLVEALDEIADILRAHLALPEAQRPFDPATSAALSSILLQLQVREAVLQVAATLEPDEQYDPSEDPREEQAVARLVALLGSAERARGVSEALHLLRYPPTGDDDEPPAGTVLAA